jgi:pterin-4a-carbinolamine dehydratase
MEDAQRLLTTVDDEWELNAATTESSSGDNHREEMMMIPTFLSREFPHADFMEGSSFLTHVAAVAQMNDHFPSLHLERRLDSRNKAWGVVSTVTCHTKVLQGLSHHDFFLATVRAINQIG